VNTAWATVVRILPQRTGSVRLICRLEDGGEADAVAYTTLSGPIHAGDRVLLNTTAVDLGLGTGGLHFVIANASAPGRRDTRPGHIMKLRYTPLQMPVLAVEEEGSPFHEALRDANSLDGMPVACCELLSQAPAVLAGIRFGGTPPPVAAVVTGEAALPVAFSDLLAELREREALQCIISAGHAFGGDLEAVSLYSGLLAARHAAGAGIAIVTPGPGTVGTGTRWGFGGVAQGEALNAVHALGGRAVGVVRASSGDARTRHRGISHHTRTVFTRIALGRFSAAWPADDDGAWDSEWEDLCLGTVGRMRPFRMAGCGEALDAFEVDGPALRTMGRDRGADALFFEAAAAAGLLARRMLEEGSELERDD